ncbi:hypothetical protein MUK70_11845 [Dyadobacter chenwenxiniae]|uniref:Uncharacterized protein n=1 Tax=Dyadobacter chenwenxiniae TaxID=2906456 RepID=A0A9X1TCQ0_9BACT|nr:hypothetical protein [Dyadobacter chenwenxiniae]MCF0059934.1 hypothetical protein [Dyadobacter chenwenxiniae]UON85673.1 hypothetical protein MUK70_11845 [Dyadobacter chenwenxiniae]
MEYYDKTIFEITVEMKGYNSRWEERVWPFRELLAKIHNVNVAKGKAKRPWELMPFPSEMEEIAWQTKINGIKDFAKLKNDVKARGDGGSRVNSKV